MQARDLIKNALGEIGGSQMPNDLDAVKLINLTINIIGGQSAG